MWRITYVKEKLELWWCHVVNQQIFLLSASEKYKQIWMYVLLLLCLLLVGPVVDILKVGCENHAHLVVDDGIALICRITSNLSAIVSLYLCVFYCQISEGKDFIDIFFWHSSISERNSSLNLQLCELWMLNYSYFFFENKILNKVSTFLGAFKGNHNLRRKTIGYFCRAPWTQFSDACHDFNSWGNLKYSDVFEHKYWWFRYSCNFVMYWTTERKQLDLVG